MITVRKTELERAGLVSRWYEHCELLWSDGGHEREKLGKVLTKNEVRHLISTY